MRQPAAISVPVRVFCYDSFKDGAYGNRGDEGRLNYMGSIDTGGGSLWLGRLCTPLPGGWGIRRLAGLMCWPEIDEVS